MGRTVGRTLFSLTEREREIARLMAQGETVGSTAQILRLKSKTVGAMLPKIYQKLGIECGDRQIGLIRMAIKKRWNLDAG